MIIDLQPPISWGTVSPQWSANSESLDPHEPICGTAQHSTAQHGIALLLLYVSLLGGSRVMCVCACVRAVCVCVRVTGQKGTRRNDGTVSLETLLTVERLSTVRR